MSNHEKCLGIISSFTEEQLGNVAALLSSAKALIDESADDAFCARLFAEYRADMDKGTPPDVVSFAEGLGISL